MPFTPIEVRLLTQRDLAAAMRLTGLAGWNQTEADWRRLLKLEPHGCFAAWSNEQLVATTTTTSYGDDLAWIGMVLVDPAHRRGGIATQLLRAALAYLRSVGVKTIKLDATPAGQPVYEALTFVREGLVERWAGVPQIVSARGCQSLDAELLPLVWALDREAFGADRRTLLERLLTDACVKPLVVCEPMGQLCGYALARCGTNAAYLGPLMATQRAAALTLLDGMLVQLQGQQVYIDLHAGGHLAAADLTARGFHKQRELIRMRAGDERGAGTAPAICAIAGPEIG